MSCNCREVRRYQHGKQTGGYIEKCPYCREKEAAAQEAIIQLAKMFTAMVDPVYAEQVVMRCRTAGWETEG